MSRLEDVLDPRYVEGLTGLPLAEVRARRAAAEQEENGLSYLRRLLQGRLDILRAELTHRAAAAGQPAGKLVDELPHILGQPGRGPAPPHGLGRHLTLDPPDADSNRQRVESLLADAHLADLSGLDEAVLDAAARRLADEEAELSRQRHHVQAVVDACSAELARRYRVGEAVVDDLLQT